MVRLRHFLKRINTNLPGTNVSDAGRNGPTVNTDQFKGVDAQFCHIVDPSPQGSHRVRHDEEQYITELNKQLEVIFVSTLNEEIGPL